MLMEAIVLTLILLSCALGLSFEPDTLPFFTAIALLGSAVTLIVLRIVLHLNLVVFVPI